MFFRLQVNISLLIQYTEKSIAVKVGILMMGADTSPHDADLVGQSDWVEKRLSSQSDEVSQV
jgi:hypothetical protein